MERNTQRIIAVVVVAVVIIAGSIGAWIFLLSPTAGYYNWTSSDCPGTVPANLPSSRIIKIGVIGDMGHRTGDSEYNGAYLACKKINNEGGINVSGVTYYLGLTSEDTDEADAIPDSAKATTAAERMISYKKVQFVTGAFRSEMFGIYGNLFMKARIPFISTGPATDDFTSALVRYYYNGSGSYGPWKYYFRITPMNISAMAREIADFVLYLAYNNGTEAVGGNYNITRYNLILEDYYGWNLAAADIINATLTNNQVKNLTFGRLGTTLPGDAAQTTTNMQSFWNNVVTDDSANPGTYSITIPFISGPGGSTMMSQLNTIQAKSMCVGIDVPAQEETYWTTTSGGCEGEMSIVTMVEGLNKTALSIPMWSDYVAEFGINPIYNGIGTYDAILMYNYSINVAQSFNPDDIVDAMEAIPYDSPQVGAGGEVAWTSDHDAYYGYGHAYAICSQWVDDGLGGGKLTSVPTLWEEGQAFGTQHDIYPDWVAFTNVTVPSWW